MRGNFINIRTYSNKRGNKKKEERGSKRGRRDTEDREEEKERWGERRIFFTFELWAPKFNIVTLFIIV
eukprot:80449-Amorphochlora_amoeboformis.AAC.1